LKAFGVFVQQYNRSYCILGGTSTGEELTFSEMKVKTLSAYIQETLSYFLQIEEKLRVGIKENIVNQFIHQR
jgi:hypothetical protein